MGRASHGAGRLRVVDRADLHTGPLQRDGRDRGAGRFLVDIASERCVDLTELVRTILTAPQGERTICIQFIIDEADIETNLRHPLMMVGSDGIPNLQGRPHPRLFGTFPRVLAEYVRGRGVLPLAEAVRRMTSLSCDRFGLADRGRVREG